MTASDEPEPTLGWLESDRVVVRRFAEADLAHFLAYRRDPAVARYQRWPTSDEDAVRSFLRAMSVAPVGTPGEWFQFAVEHKRDRSMIGDMGLHVSLDDRRQAKLGYTLAPTYQAQGLATEMVTTLLDYLFGTLQLHRIYAHIPADNHASIALAERLNFRREAHFVEAYWFDEYWSDEYLYAVLVREWRAQRARTNTAMNSPTTA